MSPSRTLEQVLMPKYFMIIEKVDETFSAYLPDVPGCVATGGSPEEAAENIRSALKMHLDGLREDGTEIPEPHTSGDYVVVE